MDNLVYYPNKPITNFCDPNLSSNKDGLIAIGGDLSPASLINAYNKGIFPWFSESDPILWWSPLERCYFDTREIHISKSMKKTLRKNHYKILFDTDFRSVIYLCATSTGRQKETWITSEMQSAYTNLFNLNIAHCVSVINPQGNIVGGIYGVFIKNIFFGESMFSLEENTSKIALITLAHFLAQNNCQLIDCQFPSEHLFSLGAKITKRSEFLQNLKNTQQNMLLYKKKW